MNKKTLLAFAFLVAVCHDMHSQVGMISIQPQDLQIASDKTVSLVFPAGITTVDKGTRDLLVQKAKGVENILQVKAAKKGFSPTNLTVLTTDGTLYTFKVSYSAEAALALKIMNNGRVADAMFSGQISEWEVESTAAWISESLEPVRILRKRKYGICLELAGLHIKNDVLYYRIKIMNKTPIGYDISGLRFFVRDKKKVRRGSVQENELIPLYMHGNSLKVAADQESTLVFALPKHALPGKKYLAVDLSEANNGRSLALKVGYSTLRKAVPLTKSFEFSNN